jgi:acetyltransferase-like isoleucine patch superfamily enzyme
MSISARALTTLRQAFREARLRWRAKVGAAPVIEGGVHIRGKGRVVVGDGVRFEGHQAPIDLHVGSGAEIVLGDGVVLHSGCSIEALASVRIGAGSRLCAFSKVLDNHHHDLDGDLKQRPSSVPVLVEEDVLVGPRAILLPGAHLGRGSVVSPATVVARRTPPGSEITGYPASIRKRRP